ncbi:MAG: hypothetical protein K9N49_06605 [Candidatus Marinimicrobia bacterium]|nr:hypothetical protein [Candidatus Neomarinimicrobiota bacterium]
MKKHPLDAYRSPGKARSLRTAPPSSRRTAWRLALGVLILLVLAGLIFELPRFTRRHREPPRSPADVAQDLILGLTAPRFEDPRGFFSIVPPAGFAVTTYEPDSGYNLACRGPYGLELTVVASPVEYNSFPTLLRRVRMREQDLGIEMNITTNQFAGYDAVWRRTQLHASQVITIDFVRNNVGHNLQLNLPNAYAERFEPILMRHAETYRTGTVNGLDLIRAGYRP